MSFRPLENRILVKPDPVESTTKGGLLIPESARQAANFGTVVAMGPGMLMSDGTRWPMPEGLRVGHRVVYDGKNPWPKVVIDGETLLQLRDDTILAIVEPEWEAE